ncbi:hypothetical protein B0J15DRAFT_96721 [Fusarium solani]|uniref:Uncharacterized protein n=1 Tax=Fusarium solani TaxID=169388 RepID=A0A9P9L2Z8_FUSSL|nr:uncharacterized protein B0J15DRAFT_96721 [Fusarium solani]KAH7273298.1 hypothetical protein B0J15DRAFT_96721 [Fusarium solani]
MVTFISSANKIAGSTSCAPGSRRSTHSGALVLLSCGPFHWLYVTAHIQKPLALSLSSTDRSAGFLGWMWDPTYATSNGYEYSYSKLMTSALMLLIPGPYPNIRLYREILQSGQQLPTTDVPTGVSEWGWAKGPFPDLSNFASAPPFWIECLSNLVYLKCHESGGHLPAISHPDLWTQDVHEFFLGFELV